MSTSRHARRLGTRGVCGERLCTAQLSVQPNGAAGLRVQTQDRISCRRVIFSFDGVAGNPPGRFGGLHILEAGTSRFASHLRVRRERLPSSLMPRWAQPMAYVATCLLVRRAVL